ncbi:MAG: 3-deoxy-manno-octulosonate cytidylyltransferase [Bacteroidota bacterium]|jgi:3-deoxy-manno-octulosonate cytidylyltransferase (CMP-KDO synthetase)
MKIIGIIPSRFGSTRFPGKPLIDINGKTMIQRVYEQACKADLLSDVIVATDDERIYKNIESIGGKVMYTATHHQSGTDRCNEIAQQVNADAYINIQGDEPFIQPEQINQLAKKLFDVQKETGIATLIKPIKKEDEIELLNNPNIIKVVINHQSKAMYFSRNGLPFIRNKTADVQFYKHIGMYGYTKAALSSIAALKPSMLENAEQLEQLRWLENGFDIYCSHTHIETISIDVVEDLKKI